MLVMHVYSVNRGLGEIGAYLGTFQPADSFLNSRGKYDPRMGAPPAKP
jgi:hypothetical protein